MMKINKTTIAAAMLFAICANVHAEEEIEPPVGGSSNPNQGSGTVEFIGSIIDAPCSINPKSAKQTVDMGQVSNATLGVYEKGPMQQFDILLEGCEITTAKSVEVKFTGDSDDSAKGSLALQGNAKGAAIELKNISSGEVIEIGKATKFDDLFDGSNTLKFGATLVKTAKDRKDIVPGDFDAIANFVLTYK